MNKKNDSSPEKTASRRQFLKTSSVALASGAIASALPLEISAHVAGSDLLRVGLVGCGGRGTGAAAEALRADKNVQLVAMADAFADRLQNSLESLRKIEDIAAKIDVPDERRFVGFDGYKHVISNCDVVLLATPPHFRPLHLRAAVDAGKHIFAEKPVAVDAPGVRAVLATCEEAKRKNLSIVSGLCFRYHTAFQETIKRIHDGALGEIRGLQANDYRGSIWVKPRQPGWTDMEYQMRNWYYFTWLSGDFNVEQHVHYLDNCSWVMKGEYPARAIGVGGRTVRTGPEYGNIYDHHAVTYEYANGAKLYATCRQYTGCANEISAHVLGTKGLGIISDRRLAFMTSTPWEYTGPKTDMYQNEQDAFFAGIRKGTPINDGEYMSKSTLLAIMGRMATYTGQVISWDQAMNSKEDLTPPQYAWDIPLPEPPIAIPGVTKFA